MTYFEFSQAFLLDSLAVPHLGNVQLRFLFLRRGSSEAFTSANTPPPTGSNYEAVCEGTDVTNEVYFPSTLISKNGGVGTKPTQDIEISISAAEVNIFSKGSATLNKVQVSDLLGRVVGTYSNINTKQFTLSTNLIQHGVYLIKVLDSEGKVFTTKIQP